MNNSVDSSEMGNGHGLASSKSSYVLTERLWFSDRNLNIELSRNSF